MSTTLVLRKELLELRRSPVLLLSMASLPATVVAVPVGLLAWLVHAAPEQALLFAQDVYGLHERDPARQLDDEQSEQGQHRRGRQVLRGTRVEHARRDDDRHRVPEQSEQRRKHQRAEEPGRVRQQETTDHEIHSGAEERRGEPGDDQGRHQRGDALA